MKKYALSGLLMAVSTASFAAPITSQDLTITSSQYTADKNQASFASQAFSVSNTTCTQYSWSTGRVAAPCQFQFSWDDAAGTDRNGIDLDMYLVRDNNGDALVDAGDELLNKGVRLNASSSYSKTREKVGNGDYIAVFALGSLPRDNNPWLSFTPKIDDIIAGFSLNDANKPASCGFFCTDKSLAVGDYTGTFTMALSDYERSGTAELATRAPAAPVSEPGTLALLGLGMAGLAATRRRKA